MRQNCGVRTVATAFTATYGAGELVIGLCAEYDVLPEVGHACGRVAQRERLISAQQQRRSGAQRE